MFFLIGFIKSIEILNFTYRFKDIINQTQFCATKKSKVNFVTPFRYQFLMVITELSPNSKAFYASPVGSNPIPVNLSQPAFFAPNGNLEIIAELEPFDCITIAYSSITQSACLTKLYVIVNETFSYLVNASQPLSDECIFFAAPAKSLIYNIPQCNLGNDSITVFHEQMNSISFDTHTGNNIPGWSTTSKRPWMFRLTTKGTVDDGYALLVGNSSGNSINIIPFFGEPIKLKIPPPGIFRNNYLIPIIGIIPTLFLIFAWLYAYSKLLKKKTE